ncbi:MAG: glycosyltransferase family 2 protein [Desulfarculaceae bacterium]|nr:glycosyltransferase family 2 protein [Desulfarculaceae bacterium]
MRTAIPAQAPHPGQPRGVSLIIVNYNAGKYLQRCLDALAAQEHRDFQAIVVDNGSDDGSLEGLALPDERFSTLPLGKNLGFAAANNMGARLARHAWIVTLNPDAFPEPGWLGALVQASRRYPRAVMFDSTLLLDDDPNILDGTGDCLAPFGLPWRSQHGHPSRLMPGDCQVFSPCAAAAMYRKDAFEAVGGFDESFFCYCEDVDLAYRMRLLGGMCVHVENARVRHVGGGITSSYSDFSLFYGHRNSIWMNIKNSPGPFIFLTLPAQIAVEAAYALFLALAPLLPFQGAGQHRNRNGLTVLRALGQGLLRSGPAWRARKRWQKKRLVSCLTILKGLCWSLPSFIARGGCHRAISDQNSS